MIFQLTGVCQITGPDRVIVNVGGVGYGLQVPLSTLFDLQDSPESAPVRSLWVYTHVREDAIRLFGFSTSDQREVFDVLLSVSGVGPRLALSILSHLEVKEIPAIVFSNDVVKLSCVPGIGKRTAEKILLELKEKIKKLSIAETVAEIPMGFGDEQEKDLWTDVHSALLNFGYKDKAIHDALSRLKDSVGCQQLVAKGDFPALMKFCLQKMISPVLVSNLPKESEEVLAPVEDSALETF